MSAEILRQAAALMNERAAAATPSPWFNRRGPAEQVMAPVEMVVATTGRREDRRHIAGWQPNVAVNVAGLLEIVAAGWEDFDPDGPGETEMQIVSAWALNVAKSYLGEWLA